MAYIGTQPLAGQYRKLDNISSGFNGTNTSFTTSVGGINVTAGSPQQLLVSLGGVIQQPITDYTVNTSVIIFTTAPSAGLDFFAILMGDALNTSVPADGSVTSAKLAGSLNIGLGAGSASTPSLFFSGDANTGIYSPGADQVAITTSGTGRLFIDSSGRLLVGTSTARSNFFGTTLSSLTQTEGTGGSTARGALSVINNDVSNNPPYVLLGRSGAATLGSNAAVVSGSRLGTLTFHGADGTSFIEAATVAGEVDGTPGTNDMPGRLVFSTTADGAASPTERLRITSAGLVGIGTSSPAALFHVNGSSSGRIALFGTGTGYQDIALSGTTDAGNGTVVISPGTLPGSGTAEFYTYFKKAVSGASTTNHNVIVDGKVGIGVTSPSSKLSIATAANSPALDITDASTSDFIITPGVSSGVCRVGPATGAMALYTGNSERARIDSSGRLLVGTSSSSSEAKLLIQGGSTGSGAALHLQRNVTTASAGSTIGYLRFANSSDNAGATIVAEGDGTWSDGSSHPTRLVFSTTADGAASPTERMRIQNTGTTTVFATTANVIGAASNQAAGTTYYLFYGANNATNTTSGTTCFLVYTNGNVQNTNNSYAGISDLKLKENVVNAGSQWDDLKALQVRKYNFREETGQQTHTQIGLVAQEVELVSPGLVTESPDRDEDGNDLGTVTKSVNYSVLYMKAVKALQEAMERIEQLEAAVTALQQS